MAENTRNIDGDRATDVRMKLDSLRQRQQARGVYVCMSACHVCVTVDMTTTGTTASTGNLSVNDDKFVVTAADGDTSMAGALVIGDTASVTGDLNVNDGKFVVTAHTGDVATAGSLTASPP